MAIKGLLIIISGPSGVGKGTVRNKLFQMGDLNLAYSISMTTRDPRVGEVDGKDYFFVSNERFDEAVEKGELLEKAEFVNHRYGTPREYVESLRNIGYNVILEIEVDGAKQVIQKCHDAISIFLVPPSEEELEHRIRGRGTENDETIKQRMSKAHQELQQTSIYSHVVTNDDLDRAANEIHDILIKYIERNKEALHK